MDLIIREISELKKRRGKRIRKEIRRGSKGG